MLPNLLMIVCYFNFKRVTVMPFETDAPLIIDADAVSARAVASEHLKMIGGRHTQILQRDGTIEHTQLSESHLLNVVGQLP